jgi:hypothetical protein
MELVRCKIISYSRKPANEIGDTLLFDKLSLEDYELPSFKTAQFQHWGGNDSDEIGRHMFRLQAQAEVSLEDKFHVTDL